MKHRDFSGRKEPTFAISNATSVVSSDPRVLEIFGVVPTAAGMPVTEKTSMRQSAAYACVRLISSAISSLPVDIYGRKGNVSERINEESDIWWLLNEEPHARWTASGMWKFAIKCELLRGDGIVFIQRNRNGVVLGLKPLVSEYVSVDIIGDRLRYYWIDENGDPKGADQDDILHFPGFGFDGVRGMSAIQWGAKNGLGIALATDEFAGKFFSNGAQVKHVLKAPGKMSPEQVDQLRQNFAEKYQGLDNMYRPMVLTEGLDVRELSLSAEDSQLLESRKFHIIDIARAFGVPPFMIGEQEKTSSWGSGVEHMSLGFVKYTLQERLTTMEQELNRKLFKTSRLKAKFNVDELLRGDSVARAKFLRELVGGSNGPGIITRDEARGIEGWAPIGGEAAKLYEPKSADPKQTKGGADAQQDPAAAQG